MAAKLRVPLILKKAGFTAGNNGSVEQRIQLPGGTVDIIFEEGAVKKIKDTATLVKAVAFLGFQGGQKSRQAEIESILGQKQTLDKALDAVIQSQNSY